MGQKIIQGDLSVRGELLARDGIYCGEDDNIFIGTTEITINGSRVITEDTMSDISGGSGEAIDVTIDENSTLQDIVNALIAAGKDYTKANLININNSCAWITIFSGETSGTYFVYNLETGFNHRSGGLFAQENAYNLLNGSLIYQDNDGNTIDTGWYDVDVALSEIHRTLGNKATFAYVDEKASEVKNNLLNGAGAAYDTLKELGNLIDANTTALDALETVATNKADKGHTHTKSEITDFPTLATVATSGSYNDLVNKPTIPEVYALPEAGESLGGVKSGGDVTISGGVITVNDDSHNHTQYITGSPSTYDLNQQYNAYLAMVAQGSNLPSGSPYGVALVLPYRNFSGNTTPDYGAQIFLPNGDDATKPNSMFYRTSLSGSWNAWQEVATTATATTSAAGLMSAADKTKLNSTPTFSFDASTGTLTITTT